MANHPTLLNFTYHDNVVRITRISRVSKDAESTARWWRSVPACAGSAQLGTPYFTATSWRACLSKQPESKNKPRSEGESDIRGAKHDAQKLIAHAGTLRGTEWGVGGKEKKEHIPFPTPDTSLVDFLSHLRGASFGMGLR